MYFRQLVGGFRRHNPFRSSPSPPALKLHQQRHHSNSSSVRGWGGLPADAGMAPMGGQPGAPLFQAGPYPVAPPNYAAAGSLSPPAPLTSTGGSTGSRLPMYEFNGKQYHSYHDMLDAYEDHLEGYMRQSAEAVQKAKHKTHMLRRFEKEGPKYISREYARTFIPLVVVLWFYLLDQNNRGCAEMAQRRVKSEAQQKLKTKWIEV